MSWHVCIHTHARTQRTYGMHESTHATHTYVYTPHTSWYVCIHIQTCTHIRHIIAYTHLHSQMHTSQAQTKQALWHVCMHTHTCTHLTHTSWHGIHTRTVTHRNMHSTHTYHIQTHTYNSHICMHTQTHTQSQAIPANFCY